MGTVNISRDESIRQAEILEAKEIEIAQEETAQQTEGAEDLLAAQEDLVNPQGASFALKQKALKEQPVSPPSKAEQKEEAKKVLVKEDSEKQADIFTKSNPEMKKEVLILLLKKAQECKSKEELLTLLNEFYKNDPMLQDQALEYLLLVSEGSFKEIVEQTKAALAEMHGKEITAGKNIDAEVQHYSQLHIGEPTKLRELYKEVTGTQREPLELFKELMDRYQGKEMRTVLAYLFHAIGADLKKGPSIESGFLNALLREVRSLQAGLGMQKFFTNRMKLIDLLFNKNELTKPKELTSETLTRQFIALLQDRYPASEKVLQLADKLGISAKTLAEIIVFSQMRDGVRETALNLFYRSVQHRDEVLKAIIDALEILEEQYDAEIEQPLEEDFAEYEEEYKKKHQDEQEQTDKPADEKKSDTEDLVNMAEVEKFIKSVSKE